MAKIKSTAVYKTPFSKAYWVDAAAELKDTKMLVVTALMIALRVALKPLAIPLGPQLSIQTAMLATALGAMIFGPVAELSIFGACYIFTSPEQAVEVVNGPICAELYDKVAEDLGIRILGGVYQGRRTINLRMDKEIKSRADLKGILMRVPNAKSWMDMGYALGCEPTAMALSEVYLALQAGTVDGQDNPLQATMNYGFGEVTKSITMTNHVISPGWLCISEEIWQSFDDETKAVFQEGFNLAAQECYDAYIGEETDLMNQFREMGLTVYEPDMTQMQEEVWEFYWANPDISGQWDKSVYDAIVAAA